MNGFTNSNTIEIINAKIPVVSATAWPTSMVDKIALCASGCLATLSTAFPAANPCPIPIPTAAIIVNAAANADRPDTKAIGVTKDMND